MYDFSRRSPMSYRGTLRHIPESLRRQWWTMRMQYASPRVDISLFYLSSLHLRTHHELT
jgi:hypothetical protein